ncbi:MAG TPA: hypothetical protein ACFYD7_05610 [Candidatus Wujingus californicus]|uniref:hypothetical protein n=1 Tax=Candidatus Wujingus californicus TaxID=3367618 RepID=UPI001D4F6C50|nr:hypothetical protein [Planctomycetota bacterium]MDO8131496.1 hypothetical protein [Candidatus Brocadiales bacterium]
MDVKNFIFKHIEKIILGIAVSYLIYTVINTLIILNINSYKANTRLETLSNAVERKFETSTPPKIETESDGAELLESRLTISPTADVLQRPQVFSVFGKEEAVQVDTSAKKETKISQVSEITISGDKEFTFKGGSADIVLIQVRKLHKDKWWIESFLAREGDIIGERKVISGETVNFNTQCKLVEIVPVAQKQMVVKKTISIKNEAGEFVGTSFAEETHMISTSKIVFEYKKGETYNLWLGELVKLGTETTSVSQSEKASSIN